MNIFFCGGGTLGPVTPLIATIDALRELRPDFAPIWIGSRKGVERAFVGKLGIEYHWISAGKFRRYFDLRTLLVPFVAVVAIFQSAWLILKLKPKAVVVSGSFIQVPLVMTARCLGVPTVLLQLDVEAGLANRISAYDAKAIFASLEPSVAQFGKRKAEVVGAPVRKLVAELNDPVKRAAAREKGLRRWNLDQNRPTLLVMGGGTGALSVNEFVVRNLDALVKSANVLHLTGKGKAVKASAERGYAQVEFLNEEMGEAYAVADLAVFRAGLGGLSEIGALGIPAVLLPLPGHQEKNAAYVSAKGAALSVKSGYSDEELLGTVLRLVADRDRRAEMGRAASDIFPSDAAERFAVKITKFLPPPTSPIRGG